MAEDTVQRVRLGAGFLTRGDGGDGVYGRHAMVGLRAAIVRNGSSSSSEGDRRNPTPRRDLAVDVAGIGGGVARRRCYGGGGGGRG